MSTSKSKSRRFNLNSSYLLELDLITKKLRCIQHPGNDTWCWVNLDDEHIPLTRHDLLLWARFLVSEFSFNPCATTFWCRKSVNTQVIPHARCYQIPAISLSCAQLEGHAGLKPTTYPTRQPTRLILMTTINHSARSSLTRSPATPFLRHRMRPTAVALLGNMQ